MSEPRQLALEMALEVDRVTETIAQATAFVAGHDQADTARNGELRPRQSALRTRLEHAGVAAERVAEWLRDAAVAAAQTPPPDGPPITRDQGPI